MQGEKTSSESVCMYFAAGAALVWAAPAITGLKNV